MLNFVRDFVGGSSERTLKKLRSQVDYINQLEGPVYLLPDDQLCSQTALFKVRLHQGEDLDGLLPEAFASVREASRRFIGLRHFDSQLLGGIVLHQGKVAEMKTGEGKTLVATLPIYLNALVGKGVHLVTVNDYLARRDVQWMGPVYQGLGLSVAALQHDSSYLFNPDFVHGDETFRSLQPISRKEAYQADITYGTNHEFGFDYLRDNMAIELDQMTQVGLQFAIVDEVDYILIDEARTPLIISGAAQESTQIYTTVSKLAPRLKAERDFIVDEKIRTVSLTDQGITEIERALNLTNLYDPNNALLIHYIENALRSQVLFRRDRDYVVDGGQVVIVDEFTGRLMEGRRYSDGLHQAIEAKEGVRVQQESLTYASITLQNYFRMYGKLAGMTGTAATESEELTSIYGLDVVTIPTNRPMVRDDSPDLIYKTTKGKWQAVAKEIERRHKTGQPVLVGTTSIENSETLSSVLEARGIPHNVLNAKFHEREAAIVAQAGRQGAVTVATNMAGRGTDIILGGNLDVLLEEALKVRGFTRDSAPPELLLELNHQLMDQWEREHRIVLDLEGLFVLGTERHEARRIDNQLRGRSGRQGDAGTSQFFVALDDEIMRRFGGERIQSIMDWAGIEEEDSITNRAVSKTIELAQTRVEGHNFEIRKHLVEYDDVINRHREVIYGERRKVLEGADLKSNVLPMIERELQSILEAYVDIETHEEADLEDLVKSLNAIMPIRSKIEVGSLTELSGSDIYQRVLEYAFGLYDDLENSIGHETMRQLERLVMLRSLDAHWVLHLTSMENLRQGIGLFAYGQRDPLVTYRTQGHQQFQEVLLRVQHDIVYAIYHFAANSSETPDSTGIPTGLTRQAPRVQINSSPQSSESTNRNVKNKVGRNDPCPCGSGRKYKRCHGNAG